MSVSTAEPLAVPRASRHRAPGVGAVFRVEVEKIAAQFLPRLVAAACVLGPFVFALIMRTQTSVPADTLFGRWVHTSGFSIPFVVLGFAGIAGFPLLTSVVAGDIFAGEDRHMTWKTVLTRSCSRKAVFAGKAFAALAFSAAMVALLAVSSTVAGIVVIGWTPLINLSGTVMSPGRSLALVLQSFGIALIPTLAFTSMAILFSVASRNSLAGVLGPPVTGLVMVLLSMMGSGLVVRSILLTTPFEAWHGLLVQPKSLTPFLLGLIVSAIYSYLCLSAAWGMVRRREFTGETGGVGGAATWKRLGRAAAIGLAIATVVAVAAAFDRTWISSHRVEDSVGATFTNLVRVQQTMLGHPERARSFTVSPFCARESAGAGVSQGAGDDWVCQLNVNGAHLGQLGLSYNVVVKPNGCYTAEGPPGLVGGQRIREPGGHSAVNPLYAFDGCLIGP
jgi:ABC-2 type transport system permease protein